MSKKENDYNPFEGLDGESTPGDLLQALMQKAIQEKDLRPIGGIIGMLQKQVEATMQHLGGVMQQLREEVGQASMMSDVTRLTIALIIRVLVDKDIITKEEFDSLYKEKVTDVMDNHMKELEKQRKEMQEKEKERIEEFAKKAAENPEVIMDPETGEIVSAVPEEDGAVMETEEEATPLKVVKEEE